MTRKSLMFFVANSSLPFLFTEVAVSSKNDEISVPSTDELISEVDSVDSGRFSLICILPTENAQVSIASIRRLVEQLDFPSSF